MKMIKQLFILFLLFFSQLIQAQDFDIYPRLKDDNIEMPNLYENTLFDEYQLLSRNIRMMDMAYSAIVPGYIHFKTKDYATGYALLGARLIGYTGLAINYYNINKYDKDLGDILSQGTEYNTDKIIFISSISLIVSSYLFDWIHGKYRLEKKQEYIRYKYSIKLNLNNTAYNSKNTTPYFSLTYNF